MIRQPIKTRTHFILMACSILTILIAYSILCHRQKEFNSKDTTIPDVAQFVQGFKKITTPDVTGEVWLWRDLKATYSRHFTGMAIGVFFATLIGIAMGVDRRVEAWFEIPLDFLAKIAPTAMLPIYFVLFGTEFKMFTAMVAIGIFPTLTQTIYFAAKKDIEDHAVYKAYSLGASSFEVIICVVFRQILPRIIEAVRAAVGPAMVFLIAAELLVADSGFGYTLRIQGRLMDFAVVFIYLFILGLTGYFINWSLKLSRRWLCPWYGE